MFVAARDILFEDSSGRQTTSLWRYICVVSAVRVEYFATLLYYNIVININLLQTMPEPCSTS